MQDCIATSSNPSVVQVTRKKGSIYDEVYLQPIAAGTSIITVEVTKEGMKGFKKAFALNQSYIIPIMLY